MWVFFKWYSTPCIYCNWQVDTNECVDFGYIALHIQGHQQVKHDKTKISCCVATNFLQAFVTKKKCPPKIHIVIKLCKKINFSDCMIFISSWCFCENSSSKIGYCKFKFALYLITFYLCHLNMNVTCKWISTRLVLLRRILSTKVLKNLTAETELDSSQLYIYISYFIRSFWTKKLTEKPQMSHHKPSLHKVFWKIF